MLRQEEKHDDDRKRTRNTVGQEEDAETVRGIGDADTTRDRNTIRKKVDEKCREDADRKRSKKW